MDLGASQSRNRARALTAFTLQEWMSDTPDGESSILIDLSNASFVDPAGLAVVAVVAEDASLRGLDVEFIPPSDRNVHNYLSRMNLGQCLAGFCNRTGLRPVRHNDQGDRLLELQRFESDDESQAVAERVFNAALTVGHTRDDAKLVYRGITEVLNNAVEHSGAVGGWAAMQLMPGSSSQGRITFAVADAGVGMVTTIRDSITVLSDGEAIERAFDRGVSSTGDDGRGNGLADLSNHVKQHSGTMRTWSGSAEGFWSNSKVRSRSIGTDVPGTLVYAGFRPSEGG